MDEQGWVEKSQEMLSDIKEWRQAHPKATFVEIEDEVHRRMMQLEAHVLRDAAQESASRVWGQETSEAPPHCPTCQVPLQARGRSERTLPGNGGAPITLPRTYGTCPKCGESFFPPRSRNEPSSPAPWRLGNQAIWSNSGVGCRFGRRVGSSKSCSGFPSVQKQPAGFAKQSANGVRNSKQPKPNSPGRKKPARKSPPIAWPSARMGPWSH